MALLLLLAAILAEVGATFATRYSEGFTRLLPTGLTVAGVALAYYLFALSLDRGTDVSVGYAVWAALGVSLVAVIGTLFLGETLTWVQGAGIVLVIVGVLALQLGSATT